MELIIKKRNGQDYGVYRNGLAQRMMKNFRNCPQSFEMDTKNFWGRKTLSIKVINVCTVWTDDFSLTLDVGDYIKVVN